MPWKETEKYQEPKKPRKRGLGLCLVSPQRTVMGARRITENTVSGQDTVWPLLVHEVVPFIRAVGKAARIPQGNQYEYLGKVRLAWLFWGWLFLKE